MATEFTPNYNLDKYTAQDKPNLRDQYNAAMDKIDIALLSANTNATEAKAATQGFQTQLDAKADKTEVADDIATAVAPLATKTALQDETSARQSADTSLGNRISILENPTKYIATIGDSFGNADNEWAALTATKTGYQLINRCTNEAGFTYNGTDGKTFIGQLQDIKANSHFANVEYIIVYGGVNDFTMQSSAQQVKNAISTFMYEYDSISGKKPKLIFAFGNFGNGRLRPRASEFPAWYNEIIAYCRTIGIPVVDYVPSWLACSDTLLINSDNLHPNTTGENVIASYIQALINGTYNGVHRSFTKTRTGNMLTTTDVEVPNSSVSVKEILSIDNNIARASLIPISQTDPLQNDGFEGNKYYSFGNLFQASQFWTSFGTTTNEHIASNFANDGGGCIATQVNTSTGYQSNIGMASINMFNFGNGTAYWKCFGSKNAAKNVFTTWATPATHYFTYQMY